MKGEPKLAWKRLLLVRNTGTLNPRERYGVGAIVVVVGVTPHQGDGKAVHRAKGGR